MREKHYVDAMEWLTEGRQATLSPSRKNLLPEVIELERRHRRWVRSQSVVGFGVGHRQVGGNLTRDLALRVYVRKKKPASRCRIKVPSTIQVPGLGKLDTDVIELGTLRLLADRTHKIRPAPGGCAIGWGLTTGTMGLVLQKNGQPGLYLLSNSHVIANSGLLDVGDPVYQPAPVHGSVERSPLASLAESVPLLFSRQGWPNKVDAAIARLVRSNAGSKAIMGIGEVRSLGVPKRGMTVRKSGYATDLTYGQIIDIHFRGAPEDYPTDNYGSIGRAGFKDQILVTRFSAKGDSGSLVVDEDNRAIGLLFAGSDKGSVCNKISNVFQLLDLDF